MSMPNIVVPNIIVLSGPNGAGKSTVAPSLLQGLLGVDAFVNADVIARGLSAFDPESAAIQAGRIMLERLHELARQRADFAFETTLASRSFASWIGKLTDAGYVFRLAYVWVPSADLCIERVARRVAAGGHHVPDEVVRRRYASGLRNFFELYRPLARTWQCYDNSDIGRLRLIAEGRHAEAPLVYDESTWSRVWEGVQGGNR
jgi:predicted ABC-type ATPase